VTAQGPVTEDGAAKTPAGQHPAPLVPEWLVNLAALAWRVIAVAGLLVVLWLLATLLWTVTAAIAVAVVIAAAFAPFVLRLRARGRSRDAAAGIVWVAAIGAISVVVLLLALAFLPYLARIAGWVMAGLTEVEASLAEAQVPPAVTALARDLVEAIQTLSGDVSGGIVSAAAGAVTVAILATFLVFFFLRDGDRAWSWCFQGFGEAKRERITTAGDVALARVGGYLRGTTVLAVLAALTNFAFMWLLGVPLAGPLAVLTFLAGYIPYFGGIVTTGIILLVTLGALGPAHALAMLVLIGIRNVVLSYGVRPAIYGRTVRIHPALVLLVLPAGFELAGIVGMFAAVPVTAIALAVSSAVVAVVQPDPRPPLPGLVPAWLDRMAQWSWRILAAVALLALLVGILVTIPLVVLPLVVAIILAATLEPLVVAMIRRGRSRGRAAAIAVGGGMLAILGVMALAAFALVDQAGAIADTASSGAESLDGSADGQLGLLTSVVDAGGAEAARAIVGIADGVASLVVTGILGTLLAYYFLRDGGRLWGRLVERVRPEVAPQVDAAGSRAFDVLGGYMVGTAAISFVGAASQLVIMVLLGLPLALPVFVLSFFLCFIPYIGGFISTGIAFLIAVAVGSPTDVLVMAVWTIAFNLVQGNIVSPLVYGRTVHIHPAIVLVAVPAGSAIAGILGMFIVVPALGVVATTWRTVLAVMSQRAPSDGPALGRAPGAGTGVPPLAPMPAGDEGA
jgi:predicted PurR-regulated permease PerM